VLSLPTRLQGLKSVAGWNAKIAKHPRLVQETQLSQGDVLKIRRQFATSPTGPDHLCFGVGETLDHGAYNAARYRKQSLVICQIQF
jgi:hypothetical protein